jgi:Putative peptidoglycan binding domain.
MPKHIVKQGECLGSIAKKNGFFWSTLWDHPQNKALKEKRKSPDILLPGDEVFIPEKKQKTIEVQSGSRYYFKRKGVPSHIQLRVVVDGEAVANATYTLEVDGQKSKGRTDDKGKIDVIIQPDAQKGTITIQGPNGPIEYELNLGHLDPIDEVSGVQARLQNLGYDVPAIDGNAENTKDTLKTFQRRNALDETGEIDQPTKDKLQELYGG